MIPAPPFLQQLRVIPVAFTNELETGWAGDWAIPFVMCDVPVSTHDILSAQSSISIHGTVGEFAYLSSPVAGYGVKGVPLAILGLNDGN